MSDRLSYKDFQLIVDHVEMLLPEDRYEAVSILGATFNRIIAHLPPAEQEPLVKHFRNAFELIMSHLYGDKSC